MSSTQVELLKVGALQPTIDALTAAVATSTTAAQTARTGAETAETNAETAETGAATARTGAETARTGAETALTSTQAAAAIATITPTADKVPRSLLHAPRLAPGWLDLGAMFFGQIVEIPEFMPIPEGWWEWAAPASGLRKITNWSPEALRRGTRDVLDVTVDPLRLYSNLLGTTLIAGPSAEVAAVRDSRGVMVATQTTFGARLKYAVQPAVGVRNRLLNNRNDGAVVGIVGSGGVLPKTMIIGGIAAGSVEVLSIAPKNGRPNTKLRINGTPISNVQIVFAGAQVIPAVDGQTWAASVWAQMAAGSMTNFTAALLRITTQNAAGAFVNTSNTAFTGTVGDDLRRSHVSTISGGTVAFARSLVQFSWTAGAVDITVDISAQQFERAGAATDVQIVGADGFDVTEAGVRSVHRLVYDGVDDFMDLASAWTSGAAYTLAAAHNLGDTSSFGSTGGTIFGNTSGTAGKFFRGSRERINLELTGANQRSVETANVAGRVVDIARMVSGGEAFYRNGVLSTVFPASDGFPQPVFNTLGRSGTGYAVGSFFGGVLINRAITEPERVVLQRVLAFNGGVTI